MTDISAEAMQKPVQAKIEESFRSSFINIDTLPAPLAPLDRISQNFYWSWHPEGVALFRELDPNLWIAREQNPRALLKDIGELRLWQSAVDASYIENLTKFTARFDW